MNLYAELKRRNVFRVAAAYVVVGWLFLQVAGVVLGFIGAPAWVGKAIIALLVLGLVPSLAVAWVFEVGPAGVRRDDGEAPRSDATHARRLDLVTLAALVVVSIMVLAEHLRVPRTPTEVTGTGAASTDTTDAEAPGMATPAISAASGTPPTTTAAAPAPRNSLAVLPFANMSPDPDNEYFADGIAEELLNVVSRIEGLKVASRTSAFSFKGKQASVREIARALDVAHVLEGSVRKQGARVRITAQLIAADSDAHLWSDTYDRDLTDIFAVQEEIAQAIAAALRGALGVAGEAPKVEVTAPTGDLNAYGLYLRARQFFYQRGDALLTARKLLEEAVARDPGFAEAWAVLSGVLLVLPDYVATSRSEATASARVAAERARKLDDTLALPYSVLAQIAADSVRDRIEAERLFDEAIARDPRDTTSLLWRGTHYLAVGDLARAERDLQQAFEIDPLTGITLGWLSWVRALRGDRQAGEEGLQRALDLGWAFASRLHASLALANQDRQRASSDLRLNFSRFHDPTPQTRAVVEAIHAAIDDPAQRAALYTAVLADHTGLGNTGWGPILAALGMYREAVAVELDDSLPRGRYYLYVWAPSERGMLAEPGFLELAERDGLLAYWKAKGYPEGCRLVEAPVRRLDCSGTAVTPRADPQ